ncbi:MAG: lipopolysaccharide biosynthesis protein [Cyanobacteria bacterium RI_101]|nr:lipopolysaccharide biosynthesis protein [Cyanobacteria bacterium RI_101]
MSESYLEAPLEELEASPGAPQRISPRARLLVRSLLRKAPFIFGFTALSASASLVFAFFQPFTYKGNFYLLVEPITAAARLSDPSTIARGGGVPRNDLTELDYPTNLAFLQGPGMAQQIAQDVFNNKILNKRSLPAIAKEVRENLKVEWIRDRRGSDATKIFAVTYTAPSAQEVEAVLTVAADTFVKYSTKDRESSLKAGVEFIDEQLPNLQRNLASLKSQQKELRQRYALVDPSAKQEALLTEISSLSGQRLSLAQQIKSQQEIIKKLQGELKLSEEEAVSASIINQDQERLSLIKRLQELDAQIASVSAVYTDNSNQMLNLKEQRNNLQALLDKRNQRLAGQVRIPIDLNSSAADLQDPTRLELIRQLTAARTQLESLQSQLPPLETRIQQLEAAAAELPKVINQYEAISREITLNEQIVDKFLLQRETLKVEAAQELPWQVISKPQVPTDERGNPIGEPPPRTKLLLAGLGGGLLFSTLLALLWEKSRNVFYSSTDAQDLLGIPLVGEVYRHLAPRTALAPLRQSISLEAAKTALLAEESAAPQALLEEGEDSVPVGAATALLAEKPPIHSDPGAVNGSAPPPLPAPGFVVIPGVFEDIYAELSFFYRSPALRSLVISAIQPGDGQSTLILNLAIAAASQGRKVLVVDLQTQSTGITQWLGGTRQPGVKNLLGEEAALESVLQKFPAHPNLHLVSAGQETPLTPLWSPDFQYLMAEFQASYDLVLYDLPSFFVTTDLYFIASHTDGLIFTVSLQKTPLNKAVQAVKKAQELRLPVIGLLTNLV